MVLKVYGPKKCLAILTKNELLGCNNFCLKAFFVVLNCYFSLFEFCLFLFPGVDLRLIFGFLTEFKKKSSCLLLDVYVRLLLGGKAFVSFSVTTADIVDVACACDLTDTLYN